MLILDTDHLSIFAKGATDEADRLKERLQLSGEPFGTTIITVEEQMRGWLALIQRLKQPRKQVSGYFQRLNLVQFLADWSILTWDNQAADLFEKFRRNKVRIGTMDLKIATIAIANGATLLSRNLADFEKVSGLTVENWIA